MAERKYILKDMLSENILRMEGDYVMGIDSVTSTNSMSSTQMITAASTDPKIKNIKNEITNAKQQMQKLSPKEELSVNEKENERKELQKEISSLNTELKQYQEELRRSQRRDIMLAKLQEDQELTKEETSEDKIQTKETSSDKTDEKNLPADDRQQSGRQGTVITQSSDGTVILKGKMNQDEKRGIDTQKPRAEESKEESIAKEGSKATDNDKTTGTSLSRKKMYAIVSADSSVQQASRQGTIIAQTRDGIAILKGEMNQDERYGVDTERKRAELEKMEKREQRAIAFQSSILGEANSTMRSASGIGAAANDRTWVNAENNAFINALKASQEEAQAAQQRFYVSFG